MIRSGSHKAVDIVQIPRHERDDDENLYIEYYMKT